MPKVEIAADASYRWREGGYVEVCPACGLDREHDGACRCGHPFERRRRGFFVTRWEPARIDIEPPAMCPHCLGKPTRVVALWNHQLTRLQGLTRAGATYLRMEVPVCARVREPIWSYLALVVAATVTVMLGVISAVAATRGGGWPVAMGMAAIAGAATWRCWRAYGWIRLIGFDHRAYRFAIRRPDYAHAFARANGGRVLGL